MCVAVKTQNFLNAMFITHFRNSVSKCLSKITIFPFVVSQLFPLRHVLSKWGCVSYLRHILGGLNNWTILCNNNNKRPCVQATLSQAYAHKVFDLHSTILWKSWIKKWLKQAQSSPPLFTLLHYHVMESFITYILISHQNTATAV
jgi:hypothetical protein